MVKFSKQFEGQLVPEWKEAFVDYWQLKKDLKKIHLLSNDNPSTKPQKSSLSYILLSPLCKFSLCGHRHRDHGVIQVHKKLASSPRKGDMYETELLEQFVDTDAAKEFFARLDLQLNKVNQFYKTKEEEFMERGESLKKQMDILIELKTALKEKVKGTSSHDSKEDPSISCTISSCDSPSLFFSTKDEDSIKDTTEQEQLQDCSTAEFERNDLKFSDSKRLEEMGMPNKVKKEGGMARSFSRGVINCQGKNVRINIQLTTPSRTLSAITNLVWEGTTEGSKLDINKSKLHHAEKMIRGAFIELYKGLGYLKTYRHLNMLAFVKIMKKFDKVTGKQVLPIYLKVVESSYLNSSDKVIKLANKVEELFVKNFTGDDKQKAMKYLKPHQRKESHSVTFFIGLFTRSLRVLFAGYVIMAHMTGMYRQQSDKVYMETVYPVLNIFMWRKSRINYSFIFELSPNKELKYREVFLICTTSMTAVMGVLFIHLSLVAKGYSSTRVQAIPGLLLLIFLLLLVCPFNIFYRSSHCQLLRVIRNIILSPLYKVVMLDFFMADQLCSQVLNLVLRLAWLQTVVHFSFGGLDYRVIGLLLAALKVIRRGQWNFYRLENEHFNNAGKFRAVKTVPLPFDEVDEED